jgi:hypothetical protein
MANTYEAIATVTVGSGGAATMAFSSIPATYTDLLLKVSARTDQASVTSEYNVTLNGSSSNITLRGLYGNGSSAGSQTLTRHPMLGTGSTATSNTFGNSELYIPNYAGSNNKSSSSDAVAESNTTTVFSYLNAALWSDSAAITSVTLTPDSGSFVQYSSATLYGIKKN